MKVLFFRHGIAEEREGYTGDDMERTLTRKGKTKTRQAALGLARLYECPDMIFSSQARRALQTAEIIKDIFKKAELVETGVLNPGAGLENFIQLLEGLESDLKTIILVGHEPDFSDIIGGLIRANLESGGPVQDEVQIRLKKASCADLDVSFTGQGVLNALYPPKILRALAKK